MKSITQTTAIASLGKRQAQDTNIFSPIHYKQTGIGNWYEQDLEFSSPPSFEIESLPVKLQIEHCYKAKIHADYLLTFQNSSGYMKAFTGIRKTLVPGWYYGDLRSFVNSETITSLVLIQFSPCKSIFRLYLFENYYPDGSKRINRINKLIQDIQLTGILPKHVLHAINSKQNHKENQESGNNKTSTHLNHLKQ